MILWTCIPASAALTDSEPVMWNKPGSITWLRTTLPGKRTKINPTNHNPDQPPHVIQNIVAISSVTELLELLSYSVLETASHAR